MKGWEFESGGNTSRQRDTVGRLKTDLTELEVFVREVLQNSIDARPRDSTEFVRVRFRIRELTGHDKRAFLDALQVDRYRDHALLSRAYEERIARGNEGNRRNEPAIQEAALRAIDRNDPAEPLRLLYIEDRGTTGLTGDELDLEAASKFCACCRDAEFSVKSRQESGGSYGKGKNVLWRHSLARMVLFHSWLDEPYQDQRSRFIGVGRLPWHAREGEAEPERFTGRCDFGQDDPDRPNRKGWSLLGEEADEAAEAAGMPHRSGNDFGTSICVVGFSPLSDDGGSGLAQRIARIAETYYWPAIHEGVVEVEVTDDKTGNTVEARPDDRADLRPYVAAFRLASEADPQRSRSHTIAIPARSGDSGFVEAQFTIGCELIEAPTASSEETPSDHVALIRGFGMVVSYFSIRPQRISASSYAGVCLAGLLDPSAKTSRERNAAADRMEVLLAHAEPEAHDRWDPKSFSGSDWRGAQRAVRILIEKLKQSITELACVDSPPEEGASMPELSRRFRLSGGQDAVERKLSIRQATPGRQEQDGSVVYRVTVDRIGDRAPDARALNLRLRAFILDRVSGLSLAKESIDIQGLTVDETAVPVTARGAATLTTIQLGEHPLPVTLDVRARPPDAASGDRCHYGLEVSGTLVEGNTAR